jgi:hypothetical protein
LGYGIKLRLSILLWKTEEIKKIVKKRKSEGKTGLLFLVA